MVVSQNLTTGSVVS